MSSVRTYPLTRAQCMNVESVDEAELIRIRGTVRGNVR